MTPRVDREAGVIHGVKVLGRESKNGREYSDKALAEAAKLYEKRDVNLNHPARGSNAERPVEAMFGWLESVEVKDDGVYADLHYATSHPMAPAIVEIAQKNPMRLGLSHNAEGTVKRVGGKNVVESIQTVKSVDLVQTPATVNGLFESHRPNRQTRPESSKTCRQILEDYTGDTLPPAPGMDDPAEMPEPQDAAGNDPADDAQAEAKAALTQVFSAALMAGGDLKSILTQVVALATAMMGKMPDPAAEDDEQSGGETPDESTGDQTPGEGANTEQPAGMANPDDEEKPDMAEATKTAADPNKELLESIRTELEQLKAERRQRECRDLLEAANVDPTPTRVDAVYRIFDAKLQQELIESFPKRERTRGPRPAVGVALVEATAVKYPDTLDSFVSAIR